MEDILGLSKSDYFEKGYFVTDPEKEVYTYFPENEYFVMHGYYSHSGIVYLLRTYRNYPLTIHFIADMME